MTANASHDRAGQLLAGRYSLIKKLGEGAFGEVWLSTQVPGGETVVIKLLHPQWARVPSVVERFRREAIASTRVNHPNVCRIFEFASTEDNTPFIAMEFLTGGTIKDELARTGAMPVARVAELMAPVCEAVSAAHQAGIVHRDLKPDNVMLTQRDGVELSIVLDFGIAKLLDATEKLTQTGSMMGTPAYMSPEQCQGKTDIGPPADVYSLAIMCYELLVGQPPFSSRTLAEMAMKHVLEPPSPLTDIPASLASAIAKSLGKKPIERPPAAVLAIALREAARVAPNARARALEIPDDQKLNPLGVSSGGSPAGSKSAASSSGSRAVVLDSHQAATVLSLNAGKEVEALVKASRARGSLATGPGTSVRGPGKPPLSVAVLVAGLIALGGIGALLGWLLQR